MRAHGTELDAGRSNPTSPCPRSLARSGSPRRRRLPLAGTVPYRRRPPAGHLAEHRCGARAKHAPDGGTALHKPPTGACRSAWCPQRGHAGSTVKTAMKPVADLSRGRGAQGCEWSPALRLLIKISFELACPLTYIDGVSRVPRGTLADSTYGTSKIQSLMRQNPEHRRGGDGWAPQEAQSTIRNGGLG